MQGRFSQFAIIYVYTKEWGQLEWTNVSYSTDTNTKMLL